MKFPPRHRQIEFLLTVTNDKDEYIFTPSQIKKLSQATDETLSTIYKKYRFKNVKS